ncbi:heparinase II/III family protein [bacterium]|nr:heparinase II/III family protein [bacterium]
MNLLRVFILAALFLMLPYHRVITAQGKTAGTVKLRALKPEEILSKLDLTKPGLEAVKTAYEKGNRQAALTGLLTYYRNLYPLPDTLQGGREADLSKADQIVRHVFQWGPYEAADYGDSMNWEWDPRGDIEWVAAVYRFYWALPLADAYRATRDERYARAFVDLTGDWIAKHPLENHEKTHPVYTSWHGFAWLDIQTGIRATNLCTVFKTMVHSKAFTPEFLAVFLASMYDHEIKTEFLPMGVVHNKAIFEQRGFVNVAYTFREFRDSRRWMELAVQRTEENLLAQTTGDGVQREWSGGYHLGVLRDAVEIMGRAETFGIPVSDRYHDRVKKMYDYIFAVATPDLGWAMFGDVSRPYPSDTDRSHQPFYRTLIEATELLGDPKYDALARLDRAHLPAQTSYAFSEAGMYILRNDWGPDQIYFALHCSPPAISSHDQPDNGTFELYAFGRWLMTDTGFFTYGHDPDKRAWHRQTSVHQTLTVDGKDTKVDGRLLLWYPSQSFDVVVVENGSYENLTHRRTIWFIDRSFFVLLDEAIGNMKGVPELHFQLAEGKAQVDTDHKRAVTSFDDANVLVWENPAAPVTVKEEEGWFAWQYGSRLPRKALCYEYTGSAPAVFLTLLVPFRGTEIPEVSALLPDTVKAGADRIEVEVRAFGKTWLAGRDLKERKAWCTPKK